MALPLARRFADAKEAVRLGFDPSRREDAAIFEELTNDLK
jgi:hypothetical protein